MLVGLHNGWYFYKKNIWSPCSFRWAHSLFIAKKSYVCTCSSNHSNIYQGSMLWSQFSAIFANFRRKNWRFTKKNNVMIKCFHKLALFWVKNAIFCENFINHNIGPRRSMLEKGYFYSWSLPSLFYVVKVLNIYASFRAESADFLWVFFPKRVLHTGSNTWNYVLRSSMILRVFVALT
jgi:hypothetical protein